MAITRWRFRGKRMSPVVRPSTTLGKQKHAAARHISIFGSVDIAVEAVEPRARENGVTYGGQGWLGRWAVDFFSALRLRGGDTGGRRRRSSS